MWYYLAKNLKILVTDWMSQKVEWALIYNTPGYFGKVSQTLSSHKKNIKHFKNNIYSRTPRNRNPSSKPNNFVSPKFLSSYLNLPSKPKNPLNQTFSLVRRVFSLEGFHCITFFKQRKLKTNIYANNGPETEEHNYSYIPFDFSKIHNS